MKKFLSVIILSIAILIPTAIVEAADVPSFSRVAGNYVPFKLREENKKNGYRTYYYECSVDLRENFVSQYISLLKRYGITYVGHDSKDWRKTSAQYLDRWYFSCRGQRVEVWQFKYFSEGRMTFSVKVPYGLTYEAD